MQIFVRMIAFTSFFFLSREPYVFQLHVSMPTSWLSWLVRVFTRTQQLNCRIACISYRLQIVCSIKTLIFYNIALMCSWRKWIFEQPVDQYQFEETKISRLRAEVLCLKALCKYVLYYHGFGFVFVTETEHL